MPARRFHITVFAAAYVLAAPDSWNITAWMQLSGWQPSQRRAENFPLQLIKFPRIARRAYYYCYDNCPRVDYPVLQDRSQEGEMTGWASSTEGMAATYSQLNKCSNRNCKVVFKKEPEQGNRYGSVANKTWGRASPPSCQQHTQFQRHHWGDDSFVPTQAQHWPTLKGCGKAAVVNLVGTPTQSINE